MTDEKNESAVQGLIPLRKLAEELEQFGEQADIHVGGTELIFPHHENKVAICQASTGKRPANFWLHSGMVLIENRKMDHALGNAVTFRALRDKGYSGGARRCKDN